jgi:anti-sigma factor RsiW
MQSEEDNVNLTDLVDGVLTGPEWEAWLAAHPEAAAEVALAQQVRAWLAELEAAAIPLPPGFEARVLARVRADATLLDLLDLSLAGFGRTLLEILILFFSLLPDVPDPVPA